MKKVTDKEYLLRLDLALSDLPFEEREEAVEFVQELFEGALQEGRPYISVIKSLGTPEEYGKKIVESFDSHLNPPSSFLPPIPPTPLKQTPQKSQKNSWWKTGLFILSLIFLVPLFLGVIMVGVGLLLSLIMVFLSLIMAFVSGILGSIVVFGKGIYLIWHDPLGAVFDFGATLFGIGLTWILGFLIYWLMKVAWPRCCEWFKKRWKSLIRWIKNLSLKTQT